MLPNVAVDRQIPQRGVHVSHCQHSGDPSLRPAAFDRPCPPTSVGVRCPVVPSVELKSSEPRAVQLWMCFAAHLNSTEKLRQFVLSFPKKRVIHSPRRFMQTDESKIGGVKQIGYWVAIHPHTGPLIETRAEIDAILDAVDPSLVFFAPDTGQIAKAGDDPVAALRTYKSITRHVHLKDYGGGKDTGYAGYVPVGSGVVDMPALFQILEEANFDGWIAVELDGTSETPRPPREAAAMSKRYLEKLLGDRAEW